nr:hypothetical protein Iba_chr11dCG13230 [Ipomoea batatas]
MALLVRVIQLSLLSNMRKLADVIAECILACLLYMRFPFLVPLLAGDTISDYGLATVPLGRTIDKMTQKDFVSLKGTAPTCEGNALGGGQIDAFPGTCKSGHEPHEQQVGHVTVLLKYLPQQSFAFKKKGQKDLVSANVSPMRMGDELCLDEVQDATVLRGEVHIVHVSYRPTSDVPFCITVEGSGNFI